MMSLVGMLLMTGCLKDGFNDFRIEDPHFVADFNAELGIPIGTCELTIEDLTEMYTLWGDNADLAVTDDSVTIMVYGSFEDDIPMAQVKKGRGKGGFSRKALGDTTVRYTSHKWMEGSSAVDIFDQFELTAGVDVKAVYVSLDANVSADASGYVPGDGYNVTVYYDSLYILYDHNGEMETLVEILDSINVDDFTTGSTRVNLLKDKEVGELLRNRSSLLQFRCRMNIQFDYSFNYLDPSSYPSLGTSDSVDQFIYDSIGIEAFHIDADMEARIPLSIYAHNMYVENDIELSGALDTLDLELDTSYIYVNCRNGIPLELVLGGELLDANGAVICPMFAGKTVAAASTALQATTGTYVATQETATQVPIVITREIFDGLKRAKELRLTTYINSADTGNPANQIVTIRKEDKLKMLLTAKVKPDYHFDSGAGSGEEGKGGAR